MGSNLILTASDGHAMDAYQADPTGDAKGRLVVIQEIFGVNSISKVFATDLLMLAMLLWRRHCLIVWRKNSKWGMSRTMLPRAGSSKTRLAMMTQSKMSKLLSMHLKATVKLASSAIAGVVLLPGFRRVEFNDAAAAACYYGGNIFDFNNENPQCPTMLHFGEVDQSIPLDKVAEIKKHIQICHPSFIRVLLMALTASSGVLTMKRLQNWPSVDRSSFLKKS